MNTYNEHNYETYAFGCIPSKKDLRDYRVDKQIAYSSELPKEYKVPHSPIKNQANVCSCVAHAVAEVLEAMNKNKEKYSTNWIYGYRPLGYSQSKGMYPRQAIKTTIDLGYVLYDDFSGNTEMKEVKNLVDNSLSYLKEKAKSRKMISYAYLKNRLEIKEAIYLTGNPVVICVHCCDPFITDANEVLITSSKRSGYHAMVAYGWNEKGLLIQNSWGENWGDSGTCILPDDYPLTEAWVIADRESSWFISKPRGIWLRRLVQEIVNFLVEIFTKNK